MGFQITKDEINDVLNCKPLAIENLLKKVYRRIQKYNPDISQDREDNNLNLSNNENLNINRSNHEISQR
jgi:hypothetical protein